VLIKKLDSEDNMALQEESSEQPESGWLSRYSQERRDLSASVEDALAMSPEQQWDEEDDEVGSWRQLKQKGSLIPPRLSLQSKQILTVHSGGFAEAAAAMQSEVAGVTGKTAKSTENTSRVNLWTRFARRVTTSLAALGANTYPEAFPIVPVSLHEEPQFLSWQHEISLLPPPISQDEVYGEGAEITLPSVRAIDATEGKFFAYPPSAGISRPAAEPATPGTRKQRVGHMTKIRLQTPPVATMAEPGEQQTIDTPMPEGMWIGGGMVAAPPKNGTPDIAITDLPEQISGTTSDYLPAIEMPVPGKAAARASLPVEEAAKSSTHNVGLMAIFGGGTIESGQSDITVADAHITSTCVVHVMLTANPGPVVVQYVSLQPDTGFTIHLTAPASVRTAFNYVILRGES
jgi:hypothetical protein